MSRAPGSGRRSRLFAVLAGAAAAAVCLTPVPASADDAVPASGAVTTAAGPGTPAPVTVQTPSTDPARDLGSPTAPDTAAADVGTVQAPADTDPVVAKYESSGGADGILGAPAGDQDCSLPVGGCRQDYVNGVIVWSPATGAHLITDPDILALWAGPPDAVLYGTPGYPTTDTFCGLRDNGCGQHFQRGSVYVSDVTPAIWVQPRTYAPWADQGWEQGLLGYPLDRMACYVRGSGQACIQSFEHGAVVWSDRRPAVAVSGPIYDRWMADGGWMYGFIGDPAGAVFCGLIGGGCGQHFTSGDSIYWTPQTSARLVSAPTVQLWAAQGWERGPLGYPTTDRFCGLRDGGCGQHFQGGSFYSSTSTPLVAVPRVLRDGWEGQGWETGAYGYPVGGAFCGLRDGGCGQHFQGGSVYWSPATGTAAVDGAERDRWAAGGWERGPLGYPTSDRFCGLPDKGCGQHFQGGSVYGKGWTAHFVVLDAVRARWAAQGWERGVLGYPTGDTFCGLRGGGCGQHFSGGSVYSSPATGAHLVLDGTERRTTEIMVTWMLQGWENGALGYPTSDPFCGLPGGGCGQHFQGGSIYWDGVSDMAVPVPAGPLRDRWAAQGWERGRLGYPTNYPYTYPYTAPGGVGQNFQGGSIRVVNGRVSCTGC